jgi:hypothetical protein
MCRSDRPVSTHSHTDMQPRPVPPSGVLAWTLLEYTVAVALGITITMVLAYLISG